jgi:hypothetical protein
VPKSNLSEYGDDRLEREGQLRRLKEGRLRLPFTEKRKSFSEIY